tara:strand:+ start:2840 stop:3373 length:534 start_codon:yes stop_codon:yes gene_type:complete
MKKLNRPLLQRLIKLASEKLTGEWVLLGGTLLPYLGIEHRVTVDVDLVGLGKKERDQQLELFQIAESLDLPIEIINPAASFFLQSELKNKASLVLLRKTANCKIYRPDGTLYLLLKLRRFTESDFSDCAEMLRYCRSIHEKVDVKLIKSRIRKIIKEESNSNKINRLKNFLSELEGY